MTDNTRALLEQALEALNSFELSWPMCMWTSNRTPEQIDFICSALRAALAAPAAVPAEKCGHCGHCGRRTLDPPWPIRPSTDDRHAQELLAQDITLRNMQARHAQELCAYQITVDKLRATPAWHDAPTEPGNWWCTSRSSGTHEMLQGITQREIDNSPPWFALYRWFGPIPQDKEGGAE